MALPSSYSMHELELRKQLLLHFIKFLQESDDPRRDNAIDHYQNQLAQIEELMNPPDIVIKLQPGYMTNKGL